MSHANHFSSDEKQEGIKKLQNKREKFINA